MKFEAHLAANHEACAPSFEFSTLKRNVAQGIDVDFESLVSLDMRKERSALISIVALLKLLKKHDQVTHKEQLFWNTRRRLMDRWSSYLSAHSNDNERIICQFQLCSKYRTLCEHDDATKRIYIDGVFDMIHVGHLRAFEDALLTCKFGELVVGVISDADAASYKRTPIIHERERATMVKTLPIVYEIIPNAPLILTRAFLEEHRIDVVVHSFASPADKESQRTFFEVPIEMGMFREVPYHPINSTSRILKRCVNAATRLEQTSHAQKTHPDDGQSIPLMHEVVVPPSTEQSTHLL